MGTVHPNKRGQNVGELATPGVVFCGARHGQLLDLGCDTASRLMLLKKRVHQVNQLARFSKTRKQVILLQPLVVILYKVRSEERRVGKECRTGMWRDQ